MSRIPITLVTGFLGSGKTTLVAHLLTQPALQGTLVVVNEFGEVGIDHDLLEASSDDTILLANGCLCCTIRGNLVDTLLNVRAQVAEGRLRDFDRVIVETSGVADPAPLLGFLLGTQAVMAQYRLERVVTVCDAMAGLQTLSRQPEATAQVLVADRLVISKSDIVTDDTVSVLADRLRRLNPEAPILMAVQGRLDATVLLGDAQPPQAMAIGCGAACGPDCEHGLPAGAPSRALPSSHTARFRATILTATRPLTTDEIAEIDGAIRAYAGLHLLRLKGILSLEGNAAHAILQAALMVVHPPDIRPGAHHGAGTVVLITDTLPADALARALARFGLLERHKQPH